MKYFYFIIFFLLFASNTNGQEYSKIKFQVTVSKKIVRTSFFRAILLSDEFGNTLYSYLVRSEDLRTKKDKVIEIDILENEKITLTIIEEGHRLKFLSYQDILNDSYIDRTSNTDNPFKPEFANIKVENIDNFKNIESFRKHKWYKCFSVNQEGKNLEISTPIVEKGKGTIFKVFRNNKPSGYFILDSDKSSLKINYSNLSTKVKNQKIIFPYKDRWSLKLSLFNPSISSEVDFYSFNENIKKYRKLKIEYPEISNYRTLRYSLIGTDFEFYGESLLNNNSFLTFQINNYFSYINDQGFELTDLNKDIQIRIFTYKFVNSKPGRNPNIEWKIVTVNSQVDSVIFYRPILPDKFYDKIPSLKLIGVPIKFNVENFKVNSNNILNWQNPFLVFREKWKRDNRVTIAKESFLLND